MLCRFWALMTDFYFMRNGILIDFAITFYRPNWPFPNRILFRSADLDWRQFDELSEKKDVCLDSNWTAQPLQMAGLSEKISDVILNQLQPMCAAKVGSQSGCKWNAIFESHDGTCMDWTSFDFWFKDFFSNLAWICNWNNHVLGYWPTIHENLEYLSSTSSSHSHFSEINELLNKHPTQNWAKNVQTENISTPINVQCYDKLIEGSRSRILMHLVWTRYSTWAIRN